ncbi:RAxF-45 family protein [Paenibacillus physcomitrellae]|nr:RAxF-45 family protein [Paenibacillus physcomitrellae]
MDRKLAWSRINQLPMILSGIFYRGSLNGIRLPFFNNLMYR